MTHRFAITLAFLALAACGSDDDADASTVAERPTEQRAARSAAPAEPGTATALASDPRDLSPDQVEAERMDSSWKRYVEIDPAQTPDSAGTRAATAAPGTDTASTDTTAAGEWSDISAESVNAPVEALPVHGDVEGPGVTRIQVLLDQVGFSPGVIDGRWGKNTEKAVYWFQKARGLGATGTVDRSTLEALEREGGSRQVETRTLTEADVSGPFETLPDDVYARAERSCLCYESLREKLGEVFHTTPELLAQLNPDVDLDGVTAGQSLDVPAVDAFHVGEAPDSAGAGDSRVARIVVSDGGRYLHALDQAGEILYHFPSTLGSDYAPSPGGTFSVQSVTFDPTWHYQPDLLTGVDPSEEDAVLPAGPNNAVGVVWMQLSKDHYGIHGTSAPSTIGYATSHGCVRLTNWDATRLGRLVSPGVPVEFTGLSGS